MANLPGTRIRSNNIFGSTTDNPLTSGAALFNSPSLADMPAVTAGNHLIVTLDPLRQYGFPEIVMVTAHTASSTVASIQRGMYGTTPRTHTSGTFWAHAGVVEDFVPILTSVTRPADPYRGQLIFETDTNTFTARDTSDAWQTVVPLGAWTSYVSTLTQSATVTKTDTYSKFTRIGRMIFVQVYLTVTGTGTAANGIVMTLPVTAASSQVNLALGGSSIVFDTSASQYYPSTPKINTTTTVTFLPVGTSVGLGFQNQGIGSGSFFAAALAVGDTLTAGFFYESAT